MMDSSCWKRLLPISRALIITACCSIILSMALAIAVGVIASNKESCGGFFNEESSKLLERSSISCSTHACIDAASEIHKNMNKSVNPCYDFYKFACGNFIASTTVPDDKEQVDEFTVIKDRLLHQLRMSMEGTVNSNDPKFVKLVKIFYRSCMDIKSIRNQGIKPLKILLSKLGGWPVIEGEDWNEDNFHWMETVFKFRDVGLPTDILSGVKIDIDLKNNRNQLLYIDQPSFGLFYEILVNGIYPEIMRAYLNYMFDIAVLLGASEETAKKELNESLLFEVELAGASVSKEKRRAITKLYNPMTIDQMSTKFPTIPWKEYLNRLLTPQLSIEGHETVIVSALGYISHFESIIAKTPKRVQANYMVWRAIVALMEYLDEDIRSKELEFEKALSGKSVRRSRWIECVQIVHTKLSLAVGSLYIRQNFDEEAKRKAIEIVQAISMQLRLALQKVKWMDGYTRRNALHKATAILAHIGYPDELIDDKKLEKFYENLELTSESYLKNVLNLSRFDLEYSIGELKKPFNRSDWRSHGKAASVDAFYLRSMNSISEFNQSLSNPFRLFW